jgi:hypothetical protein
MITKDSTKQKQGMNSLAVTLLKVKREEKRK